MNKNILMVGMVVASLSGLVACTGNGSSSSVTVEGDVPIAYVKRSNNVRINPTDAGNNGSSGDLYIREKSSPSATEYNITGGWTAGLGDVSRPEVSYDGKKIVFAMRCASGTPCSTWKKPNEPAGEDTTWSIWEYDFSKAKTLDKGDLHRVMDLVDAKKGDDFDPTYLPGGQGFVFTSRRQAKSSSSTAGQPGYVYLDEYEREHVAVLHTMDAKGGNIQQISFNQSHDRSPTILQNGRILYSRWDHVGGRNHFTLFTMKPDGTDMFVLYGAHSAGNSRLHPREMQNGRVITDLMPLSGTQEGGALMVLDVQNYSEQNTPANSSVPKNGGQQSATTDSIDFSTRSLSLNGRFTTPYPLWDGTDRVLVAFNPCQVTDTQLNKVIPCSMVPPAEIANLTQQRLQQDINADRYQDNAPAAYSIVMFDMKTQSFRTVVPVVPGVMVKDPVALLARKEPNNLVSSPASSSLTGTLSVRSVYDTDDLGRMGDAVLSAAELVSNPIPKIPPSDPEDTRSLVANIAALKDPLNPAYRTRPARFVRITKAVATPDGISRETIGETDFEMQEILGYADVEPDGSFKVKVPADTPIAITLTDAEGRAFQAHTNWIQVRPDERRTCDGCHSPRRGAALNSGMLLEDHPNTLMAKLPSTPMSMRVGETMADTRTRLDPSALQLQPQIEFKDVWANTAITGVTQTHCISLSYSGSPTCDAYKTDLLTTPAPVPAADGSITINYPDHIQPLWNLHCVSCHNATAVVSNTTKLDLSDTLAGTGRMTSYEKLLVGDPVLDANKQPVTRIRDGVLVVTLGPALVDNMASQGDAVGLARKSRLMEILSGETLKASSDARALFPTPVTSHAAMLNAAEKRLLAEWIDLGGQYYNNPKKIVNGVSIKRSVNTLSRATFDSTIHPILMTTCAGCHQAGGTDPTAPAPTFQNNRFVLTGGSEGDFNVTLSMVSNACAPDSNYLLNKPSTIPHPSTLATPQTAAVLTGTNYAAIRTWIAAGCVL